MAARKQPTKAKKAAPKKNPATKAKSPRDQYRPEYVILAESLCRKFGATDDDLAEVIGVVRRTILNWRKAHPEFDAAIERGKHFADSMVVRRLYERATGYSHNAVKIMQFQGEPVIVPYIEHHAPDTTACIFWLKNRDRENWKDRWNVEGNVTVTGGLAETLRKRREKARNAGGK